MSLHLVIGHRQYINCVRLWLMYEGKWNYKGIKSDGREVILDKIIRKRLFEDLNEVREHISGRKSCKIPQMVPNLVFWEGKLRDCREECQVMRWEEKNRARSGLYANHSASSSNLSFWWHHPEYAFCKKIFLLESYYFAQLNNASSLCRRGNDAFFCSVFFFTYLT